MNRRFANIERGSQAACEPRTAALGVPPTANNEPLLYADVLTTELTPCQ